MVTSNLAASPQQCRGGSVRGGTKGGNPAMQGGGGVRGGVGGMRKCRGYPPIHYNTSRLDLRSPSKDRMKGGERDVIPCTGE